jgi:hypothetical protein
MPLIFHGILHVGIERLELRPFMTLQRCSKITRTLELKIEGVSPLMKLSSCRMTMTMMEADTGREMGE